MAPYSQIVLSLLGLSATPTRVLFGSPTVSLDSAVVTGVNKGRLDQFLGIPYAQPPTGELRFQLPKPVSAYSGQQNAIQFGSSCPQQAIDLPSWLDKSLEEVIKRTLQSFNMDLAPENEDCLTINVIRPSSAASDSKLPVVVGINGGYFQVGGTSSPAGESLVDRSIDLNEPVIYVSMNYRLNAFGFLASKEVKAAGVTNLGLHDQREALRWIQKYIKSFGGDPAKVTLWGESAGAISIGMHMIANDGDPEGLFRGAFMQSGSILPVGDVSHGQKFYDSIVKECKCSGAKDTLGCLRDVEYSVLKKAVDNSPSVIGYQSLASPWLPRVDGSLISDVPTDLVARGKIANIPFVVGNVDDEGTLFSLSSHNITTTANMKDYLQSTLMPNVNDDTLSLLARHYPDVPSAGSPFDTGLRNMLSPQFKRLAAIIGDAVLIAPRRHLLLERSDKQKTWSFINKRSKSTPYLGSHHGSDILQARGSDDLRDYLIHFVNKLNPNGNGMASVKWPEYLASNPKQLSFEDSIVFPLRVDVDNHRYDAIKFIMQVMQSNPL